MPDWKWLTSVLRYYLPELNAGDGEFFLLTSAARFTMLAAFDAGVKASHTVAQCESA